MIESFTDGLSYYLQSSLIMALFVSYLGGVLVSFTPCVYPVIPITVAYIGARGTGSRAKGLVLSLIYVFGMSVTYMILGMAAALSGRLFGQLQSSPWMYFIMANIFIFMGLSMLDVFSLRVRTPEFLTRVQPRRKGIIGSLLVGLVSGLVMGPCTAPVFAVLLGYVATKQSIFFGACLLFAFAFGMGTLLIILGTFASLIANLPRSGAWMVKVSHMAGWILLAVGEYFLIKAGQRLA